MNTSFLLTSNKRFDRNTYLIPNQMSVKAIRVKSAIINYSEKNIMNHAIYIDAHYGDTPAPGQRIEIPNGTYTPDQYAETLQTLLNDAANSVQSQSELTAGTYADSPPVIFEATFNQATGKFELIAHVKHSFSRNISLWFNDEANDYIGQDDGSLFSWKVGERGAGRNMRTTPRPALTLPRYYRVCSNQLASFGWSYDDSMGSNILAIVPIDHSKKWTSWQTDDDFFLGRENNETVLQSLMDVEIFLEENHTPLVDPEFAITFQIQS